MAPSDPIQEKWTEGYYYKEVASRDGSCLKIHALLLLKDHYFVHLPAFTGGSRCEYGYKRFETLEEGHAKIQTYLDGDSLWYFTIDSWGRYSITGGEIIVGGFQAGDMFSKEYWVQRGRLSGETLTLSYEGQPYGGGEIQTYHFRPHPLHVDYGKIPLKKKRFRSKALPPVWFWWEG